MAGGLLELVADRHWRRQRLHPRGRGGRLVHHHSSAVAAGAEDLRDRPRPLNLFEYERLAADSPGGWRTTTSRAEPHGLTLARTRRRRAGCACARVARGRCATVDGCPGASTRSPCSRRRWRLRLAHPEGEAALAHDRRPRRDGGAEHLSLSPSRTPRASRHRPDPALARRGRADAPRPTRSRRLRVPVTVDAPPLGRRRGMPATSLSQPRSPPPTRTTTRSAVAAPGESGLFDTSRSRSIQR